MVKKRKIKVYIKLFKDGVKIAQTYRVLKVGRIGYTERILNVMKKYDYDSGTIKVIYNKEKEYWNEFDFTSENVDECLKADLDPQLIKDFS